MHEYSLLKSLLRQVRSLVAEQGGGRVIEISVSGGPLCGADPTLLASAFPLAAAEAGLAEATLQLDWRPLTASCRGCQLTFDVKDMRFVCRCCGSPDVDVVTGDAVMLESVTMLPADDFVASVEHRHA